jgi:hypothetical protein
MTDDLRELWEIHLAKNGFHPANAELIVKIILALLAERELKIVDLDMWKQLVSWQELPPYPGAQEAGDD